MIQKHVGQTLRITLGLLRSQRGITGLETAIVLIAFVVVSSVFAFAALSAGLFSSDKAKDTIHSGLAETRASMQLKGAVIATATAGTTGTVSNISFQVAPAAGGATIDLTPGQTIIKYIDTTQAKIFDAETGFTVTPVGSADFDKLLERNETLRIDLINLDINFDDTAKNTLKSPGLGTNTTFILEIIPAQGPVLFIERSTPINLDLTTNLE